MKKVVAKDNDFSTEVLQHIRKRKLEIIINIAINNLIFP